MTAAAAIIRRIRAAGGEIHTADDRLKLSIPRSVADALMPEIRANKDAIRRAFMHEGGDLWDATDYAAFQEERAAIAEFDGGLSRDDAEALAREDTITQWLHHHPPEASNSSLCAGCGHPIGEPGNDGVPFLAGDRGHLWIHHACWQSWMERRRGETLTALEFLKEKTG